MGSNLCTYPSSSWTSLLSSLSPSQCWLCLNLTISTTSIWPKRPSMQPGFTFCLLRKHPQLSKIMPMKRKLRLYKSIRRNRMYPLLRMRRQERYTWATLPCTKPLWTQGTFFFRSTSNLMTLGTLSTFPSAKSGELPSLLVFQRLLHVRS